MVALTGDGTFSNHHHPPPVGARRKMRWEEFPALGFAKKMQKYNEIWPIERYQTQVDGIVKHLESFDRPNLERPPCYSASPQAAADHHFCLTICAWNEHKETRSKKVSRASPM